MKSRILSNEKISSGIYKLVFEWKGGIPSPGQFVMVDCKGKTFLKRPISVCSADDKSMTIVYQVKGEGTKNLSEMKKGDTIEVTGPHGHGFELYEDKNMLIVGGGIGIPPLLYLAKKIKAKNLYIALGFKSEIFLVEEFKNLGEVIVTTEDGSFGKKGMVTQGIEDIIDKIDIIYGCGPKPMLKALKEISLKNNIPCQISLEERMACGMGACLVCACKVKKDGGFEYKRVCKDGPVFWAEEVEF
ncbi:dihydroorotate dehydrogenase electron transfer subunit [Thermoanaerobacter uzonensis]|uniref:dihydroorotate dehydrogenase electron transfer subunit n=1 Tax=Thermoanaerobacter uzonensis TaxID=447593 RepID=UPI003D769836